MSRDERRRYQIRMHTHMHDERVRRISLAVTTQLVRRHFDQMGARPAEEVMRDMRADTRTFQQYMAERLYPEGHR